MPRTDTEQKDVSILVKKIGKLIIMGDGIQKCLAQNPISESSCMTLTVHRHLI